MGYYSEFPHTRNYDSDLGEIIRKIEQLSERLQVIEIDISEELEVIKEDLIYVNEWINSFEWEKVDQRVDEYIPSMILPEISLAGYIIYNLPDTWQGVDFKTTGIDIELDLQPKYGHLVIEY